MGKIFVNHVLDKGLLISKLFLKKLIQLKNYKNPIKKCTEKLKRDFFFKEHIQMANSTSKDAKHH